MLWSKIFIPTLRENPVDAESAAHRLLMRAGYIRQAGPGAYTYLHLARRSLGKIERIVREEMDRIGGQECCFANEAAVFEIARNELRSPKQLPQIWYQIEAMTMQSYSFGAPDSQDSLGKHREAFARILARCGVPAVATATEFLTISATGNETLVQCPACGYAEGLGLAVSRAAAPLIPDPEGDGGPEEFHTPDKKTIADVSEFTGLPATSQMKSLVMTADGEPVLALVRGDHQLSRPKLASILRVREVVPAKPAEIVRWFGADPGSLGPVGVKNMRILADHALTGRSNMTAGANRNDCHLRNVTPGRDFEAEFADIRRVAEGDLCSSCGTGLTLHRAIRIAALLPGACEMGIERILRAVIEQNNDEGGMILPRAIAPFAVIVTPVNNIDAALREAAQRIYTDCLAAGIDVLYDDRDERPGSKFKDADLIGVPYRVTIGKKLAQGLVELTARSTRSRTDLPLAEVVTALQQES